MKFFSKRNLIISGIITSILLLNGCGSGNGGSSSSNSSGTTSVTVERGPVYNATVTDSSNPIQTAVQKEGENIYVFSKVPVYPITATGGIIDVDGNGIDEGDIQLNQPLTSYSNVITPITDYLGDISSETGKTKLKNLEDTLGIDFNDNDLINSVPSKLSTNIIVLSNTLFDTKVKGSNAGSIKTKFDEFKTIADQTPDNAIKALEEQIISDNGITELSSIDAKKINFSKKILLNKKLVNSNETYLFRNNNIILANTSNDYTQFLSYGEFKDGTLKMIFANENYNMLTVLENGYKIENYEKNSSDEFVIIKTITINKELSDFTSEELQIALEDQETITYSWTHGEWGACEGSCGTDNAVQTRTVTCQASNNQTVADNICTTTKPTNTQSCTASQCNVAPTANAGSDQTITLGNSVTLNASNSSDSDGSIVSYSWVEGSTTLSTAASFSKSNFTEGSHNITLTVTDNDGATGTDNITVTVNTPITYSWTHGEWGACEGSCGTDNAVQTRTVTCQASNNQTVADNICTTTKPTNTQSCTASQCNVAPTANAGSDQTITLGNSVTLNASNSSDSDGSIVSYSWVEGSTTLSTAASFSKSNFTEGSHNITLTVTDNDGATGTDNITVTVNKATSLDCSYDPALDGWFDSNFQTCSPNQ